MVEITREGMLAAIEEAGKKFAEQSSAQVTEICLTPSGELAERVTGALTNVSPDATAAGGVTALAERAAKEFVTLSPTIENFASRYGIDSNAIREATGTLQEVLDINPQEAQGIVDGIPAAINAFKTGACGQQV